MFKLPQISKKFPNIRPEKNPRISGPVQFKPVLFNGQLYFKKTLIFLNSQVHFIKQKHSFSLPTTIRGVKNSWFSFMKPAILLPIHQRQMSQAAIFLRLIYLQDSAAPLLSLFTQSCWPFSLASAEVCVLLFFPYMVLMLMRPDFAGSQKFIFHFLIAIVAIT